MNKKYLAYAALLAGWIFLCYWLYVNRIAPYFHMSRETSQPEFVEGLDVPFAFRWGSAVPLAGEGFEAWRKQFATLDSTDEVLVLRGHYFRDEADALSQAEALALERLERALQILSPSSQRTLTTIGPQEINADVRHFPFEAISFDRFFMSDILWHSGDTIQICFPARDAVMLPEAVKEKLVILLREHGTSETHHVYVTGTADGSGIAESADVAIDRADVIVKILLENGWTEDAISLTTGQRNHPLTLLNRCVMLYFE